MCKDEQPHKYLISGKTHSDRLGAMQTMRIDKSQNSVAIAHCFNQPLRETARVRTAKMKSIGLLLGFLFIIVSVSARPQYFSFLPFWPGRLCILMDKFWTFKWVTQIFSGGGGGGSSSSSSAQANSFSASGGFGPFQGSFSSSSANAQSSSQSFDFP